MKLVTTDLILATELCKEKKIETEKQTFQKSATEQKNSLAKTQEEHWKFLHQKVSCFVLPGPISYSQFTYLAVNRVLSWALSFLIHFVKLY